MIYENGRITLDFAGFCLFLDQDQLKEFHASKSSQNAAFLLRSDFSNYTFHSRVHFMLASCLAVLFISSTLHWWYDPLICNFAKSSPRPSHSHICCWYFSSIRQIACIAHLKTWMKNFRHSSHYHPRGPLFWCDWSRDIDLLAVDLKSPKDSWKTPRSSSVSSSGPVFLLNPPWKSWLMWTIKTNRQNHI